MTEITHEALEALNQKATQAAEDVRTKKTIDAMHAAFVAESAFARAVAALYRAGQLILAQPSGDEVEAVDEAETCAESDLWGKTPGCDGIVVPGHGGGIRCSKCSGWFCY